MDSTNCFLAPQSSDLLLSSPLHGVSFAIVTEQIAFKWGNMEEENKTIAGCLRSWVFNGIYSLKPLCVFCRNHTAVNGDAHLAAPQVPVEESRAL